MKSGDEDERDIDKYLAHVWQCVGKGTLAMEVTTAVSREIQLLCSLLRLSIICFLLLNLMLFSVINPFPYVLYTLGISQASVFCLDLDILLH